jgi:DNA polymerase I-like protein with 3'-5' exonuclease and polymerase domains
MAPRLVAFDTETYMIEKYSTAPRLVCVTTYDPALPTEDKRRIYKAADGIEVLRTYFEDPEVSITVHNASFDIPVLIQYDPSMMKSIFKACNAGRVYCSLIRELMLTAADPIVHGQQHTIVKATDKDRATSTSLLGCMVNYFAKDGIYNLAKKHNFDPTVLIDNKADKTSPRTRYCEMDGKEISAYPQNFVDYALNDALYAYDLFIAQSDRASRMAKTYAIPDPLTSSAHESTMDIILAYMSKITGISVDLNRIDEIEKDLNAVVAEQESVILGQTTWVVRTRKPDGNLKKETAETQRLWMRAYQLVGENIYSQPQKFFTEKSLAKIAEYEAMPEPEVEVKGVKMKGQVKRPKDAQLITNAQALERLAAKIAMKLESSDSQELAEILALFEAIKTAEAAKKEKNTFASALAHASKNADCRVRYEYRAYQATGRTSSSAPNMQNLPRKSNIKNSSGVRGAILPPVDGCFIQCDYSNAELRSFSQAILDEQGTLGEMGKRYVIDPNFDPHQFAAWKLVQIRGQQIAGQNVPATYEKHLEMIKANEAYKLEMKEKRQLMKAANFGFMGGLSAVRFVDYARAYGVPLTIDESKTLSTQWRQIWSETTAYFQDRSTRFKTDFSGAHIMTHVGSGNPHPRIQTLPISKRSRYCDRYTVASNNKFQAITADGAKRALRKVFFECYFNQKSPLILCRPVLFVHDEIVLECGTKDPQIVRACALRLKEIMEQEMQKWATPNIPCVAEPCATTRWVKDAESKITEDGMTVWEPK